MVFGRWFTRCPLDDPREKAWVEGQMQWFSEQFGLEPLRNAEILLPTPEHFPEPYHGTPDDARRLLGRLCEQLQVSQAGVELKVHADEELPGAAGTYEEHDGITTIRIAESQLGDPEQLVATLAHELAHKRLLGEGRISADDSDHEQVTDLLPVYFGAGVFAANAVIRETSITDGRWHSWSIGKWGYLPARLFGHAFALFAWVRNERELSWADHLRRDARTTMLQSLKYLRKTGDSLFRADTAGRESDPPTFEDLLAELKTGTASRKIAALWELADRSPSPERLLPNLVAALDENSTAIRATTLQTMADTGAPDAQAAEAVRRQLGHSHPEVRATAIQALAAVGLNHDETIQDVVTFLGEANPSVIEAAALTLAKFGEQARDISDAFATPIKRAVVRGNVNVAASCIVALINIHPDPERFLREHFRDPEIHGEASELLRELRELRDASEAENDPASRS